MERNRSAVRNFGLFSDEVFTSTDLNRRSGEVLNRARRTPVTIARNNERFALLRRDQAASLVKGLTQLVEVVQLAQSAVALRKNRPDQVAPSVAWMRAFDEEDRQSMLDEIFTSCVQASAADDWDAVTALIHQWRESASVAESGLLRQAMDAESDEQPLPHPSAISAVPVPACELLKSDGRGTGH
jgi:prevent-host-death family protein